MEYILYFSGIITMAFGIYSINKYLFIGLLLILIGSELMLLGILENE